MEHTPQLSIEDPDCTGSDREQCPSSGDNKVSHLTLANKEIL